jgi:hypothetical protein
MNKRSLSTLFVVATLTLSMPRLGLAGNYRMHSEPGFTNVSMQLEPQSEEGLAPSQMAEDAYARPPQQGGDCCMQPPAQMGGDCSCDTYGCEDYCRRCVCPPFQIFGEYLYLRPLNADIEYAVPINGPISAGQVPLQEGRTATLNPTFSSGYRVGGGIDLDRCTSISATYTHYENRVDDAITTNPPLVLRSMVVHPSSLDADADWLDASAHQFIKFELADLDYRHVVLATDCSTINYLVGVRYANLKQRFDSLFESIIAENVNTEIDFDGGGFRLGLEAQRDGRGNFSVYGKASASFLGGEFRGTYLQGSTNDPLIAQTDWKDTRFVSILDCEVGIGWRSCGGHISASAGYTVSSWLNLVKTAEFISSVQANKYHGPDKVNGNGLVFDGFVANVTLSW